MKVAISLILLLLSPVFLMRIQGQTLTQSVSGVVIDKDSRQPLIGATVVITDLDELLGATTDENGAYEI